MNPLGLEKNETKLTKKVAKLTNHEKVAKLTNHNMEGKNDTKIPPGAGKRNTANGPPETIPTKQLEGIPMLRVTNEDAPTMEASKRVPKRQFVPFRNERIVSYEKLERYEQPEKDLLTVPAVHDDEESQIGSDDEWSDGELSELPVNHVDDANQNQNQRKDS